MEKIFNKQTLREFSEKHGIRLLVLFGSQASGKTHPKSDTDIAFVSSRKKTPLEVAALQLELSSKLEVQNLDLVDLRTVSPLFLKNVTEFGKILYEENRSVFAELRMYAFKLFVETKPLRTLRAASLKHFLQTV